MRSNPGLAQANGQSPSVPVFTTFGLGTKSASATALLASPGLRTSARHPLGGDPFSRTRQTCFSKSSCHHRFLSRILGALDTTIREPAGIQLWGGGNAVRRDAAERC